MLNALATMAMAAAFLPRAVRFVSIEQTDGWDPHCGFIADSTQINPVGTFSNVRSTSEHAYGATVMLWRAGSCPVGFLEIADGLAGDTPIGELRDVAWNPRSGRIRFAAKLTTGVSVSGGASRSTPSRDWFEFTGFLRAATMTGELVHRDSTTPGSRPTTVRVVMPASPSATDLMRGSRTYGGWRNEWEPVLRRRGPRW